MTRAESKARPADDACLLPASPTSAGGRHLVLLGAGHAHVHVLHRLAQDRPADLANTLVAPHPRQLYSGMVPGFVAGHYTLDDCMIPLDGLLARCGARHMQGSAAGLDWTLMRAP